MADVGYGPLGMDHCVTSRFYDVVLQPPPKIGDLIPAKRPRPDHCLIEKDLFVGRRNVCSVGYSFSFLIQTAPADKVLLPF